MTAFVIVNDEDGDFVAVESIKRVVSTNPEYPQRGSLIYFRHDEGDVLLSPLTPQEILRRCELAVVGAKFTAFASGAGKQANKNEPEAA